MSRVRISLTEWREEDPATPARHHRRYATVGGSYVTAGPDWDQRRTAALRAERVRAKAAEAPE